MPESLEWIDVPTFVQHFSALADMYGQLRFFRFFPSSHPILLPKSSMAKEKSCHFSNVIRDGDPLEIFTSNDGEVIFKKYSPMGELSNFAGHICETMHKTTNRITAITDRDSVISVSGAPKRELGEKRISGELSEVMEARQVYQKQAGEKNLPVVEGSSIYSVSIAVPILSEGDVMGCVMFLDGEEARPSGEVENKLAQTIAGFLGKQMES